MGEFLRVAPAQPWGGCAGRAVELALGEASEGLAVLREALKQGRRGPEVAVLLAEAFDLLQHHVEAHLIGPEHGAAGDLREAIAVDVDNVDIAGANSDLVFEDARPFVDEGEDAA